MVSAAAQARERRQHQYNFSGKAAVDEIYRLQGEHVDKSLDWDSVNRMQIGEALCFVHRACTPDFDNLDADTADLETRVRAATSHPAVASLFNARFGSIITAGYSAIVDSTEGLVTEVPAPNFLKSDIVTIEETTRLKKYTKGRQADHADFSGATTTRQIARYTEQIVIDEQNVFDSTVTLGDWWVAAMELGRAARRTYLDLYWAKLLRNPTMYDGVAMFDTNTHKNYDASGVAGTAGAALSAGSLQAATSALGSQVYLKDGRPVHASLRPTHLIVSPKIEETGRIIVKSTYSNTTDDETQKPLKIVVENRISSQGVLDPEADTVITGTDVLWFVAASAAQRPAAIVSYLQGSGSSPTIRPFNLSRGQWGMGWDVLLDVGVQFSDWRSWYFAKGSA